MQEDILPRSLEARFRLFHGNIQTETIPTSLLDKVYDTSWKTIETSLEYAGQKDKLGQFED